MSATYHPLTACQDRHPVVQFENVEGQAIMTSLEVLRQKKTNREPLTAIEQVILDAFYRGGMNMLAEQAANELAHLYERIQEHLPR